MLGQLLTGRYLILEQLGQGGFSETYLARDKYLPHHPLCVVKCLKLSSRNTISPETAQRLFEMEARLLEQLGQNQTQIPTLLAYCHEQDQVYLIQEYIDGENLGQWLAQGKRLTTQAAIALLHEMLSVLDYLHTRRVIHRDIKPSNLIRRHRDGKFVLIDFGAACLLPETATSADPDQEESLLAIGTPGYMPDEQHLGMSQFNSDLYALGMLIIHGLTGVHPRQFQQDLISGELDWQDYLSESTIGPQLIAILSRMVHCNFRDRYQQAADVLADLRTIPAAKRFRFWKPGLKLPQSLGQQVKSPTPKLQKNWRHFAPQIILPLAAILLVGAIGGKYFPAQSKQAELLLRQVEQKWHKPDLHLSLLQDRPMQAEVDRLLIAPNNQAFVTVEGNHELRLWSLPSGAPLKTLSGHTDKVNAIEISRDGRLLVSAGDDRTVRLWDLTSGELLQTFTGHPNPVTAIAFSADARTLVSGSQDGSLRRWDVQTGTQLQALKLPNAAITAVAYSAVPDNLISASSDRQLQVWDLRTGKVHRTFAGHTAPVTQLKVVDSQTLFSFGADRGLGWDLKREELAFVMPEDSAKSMTAVLHQQDLLTVNETGKLCVWKRQAGRLVMQQMSEVGQNLQVAVSSDYRYLVSWSRDRHLRIWQISPKSS